MAPKKSTTRSFTLAAALLGATALPALAGPVTPPPHRDLALASPVTDVAARRVRHVTVHRHYVSGPRYVRGRHYYYRRRHSAFPAAAFGLFAGALGAAIASDYYDDGYYGYGYPSYSYGYPYSYGYAAPYDRPRYYGTRHIYSGPVYRGGWNGGGGVTRFGGGQYHGGGAWHGGGGGWHGGGGGFHRGGHR